LAAGQERILHSLDQRGRDLVPDLPGNHLQLVVDRLHPPAHEPLEGVSPGGSSAHSRVSPSTGVPGRPSRTRRAASTVLASSMVMVMGPTPPGTGVIAEATRETPSQSTSPAMR